MARKWSVAQLARKAGVDRTTIARIEAGKSFPGARAGHFARVLQVPLRDLFSFPGAGEGGDSPLASDFPAIYTALRAGLKRDPKFARRVERILDAMLLK